MPPSDADDLEVRARSRVGTVLDQKYHLERLLGVGGMAAVYEARHRNGARAAVKLLHPDIARDEEVRARFLHEGKAANRVEHPGAVRVLDDDTVQSGEDQGTTYLVMELLDGESVFARARRSGSVLPEAEVLSIADEVLAVLEAAHARGIIHRDLKPDNLFLVKGDDGRERVKVLDFGIARIADASRKTNVGTTLGTPSYMAPEQARGQRDEIDGRTDLFALGATMFRLLTGRRVHDAPSSAEVLAMMATAPAQPIRMVSEHVRAEVAAIVDRALRFERSARYPDAAAMRADVRAAREGAPLPSGSLPADTVGPSFAFAAGSDVTMAPAEEPATVAARAEEPPTLAAPLQVSASPAARSEVLTVPVVPSPAAQVELPKTRSHAVLAPIENSLVGRRAGSTPALPPSESIAPAPLAAAPVPAAASSRKPLVFAIGALALLALTAITAFALLADTPKGHAHADDELTHEPASADKPDEPSEPAAPAASSEEESDPPPSKTPSTAKPSSKPGPAKPTTTSTNTTSPGSTSVPIAPVVAAKPAAPPPVSTTPPAPAGGPGKSAGKGNGQTKKK